MTACTIYSALDPWNGQALIKLGIGTMHSPDPETVESAYRYFERAFHAKSRPGPLNVDTHQGWFLTSIIARRAVEQSQFEKARKFFNLALSSEAAPGDCTAIQAATLLTSYPKSVTHAQTSLRKYISSSEALLRGRARGGKTLDVSGTDDPDPYIFCVLSAFNHEIYFEADLALTMKLHHDITVKAFPHLLYVAPHLPSQYAPSHRSLMARRSVDNNSGLARPSDSGSSSKRIRLGIASAHFYPFNSVIDDFKGVISNLPVDRFDVTFIFMNEQKHPPPPHDTKMGHIKISLLHVGF